MPENAWQRLIDLAASRGVKVRLEEFTDQIKGMIYTSLRMRKYIIINRDLPDSDKSFVLAKALESQLSQMDDVVVIGSLGD